MTDQTRGGAFPPASRLRTVGSPPRNDTRAPFDTRYSFTWTDRDGVIDERVRMGPSLAIFTGSFAALCRGALVQKPDGPVAVEDLVPGDRVTTCHGVLPLRWKGSRVVAFQHGNVALFRVTAEALGPARPGPDLLLGPAARIVTRGPRLRALIGEDAALIPVSALEDSETVIRIRPVSALQVFHLGFDRHATFTANGVELESVHPGALVTDPGPEMASLYLSMFPHLRRMEEFGDLVLPRLEGETLARATAA